MGVAEDHLAFEGDIRGLVVAETEHECINSRSMNDKRLGVCALGRALREADALLVDRLREEPGAKNERFGLHRTWLFNDQLANFGTSGYVRFEELLRTTVGSHRGVWILVSHHRLLFGPNEEHMNDRVPFTVIPRERQVHNHLALTFWPRPIRIPPSVHPSLRHSPYRLMFPEIMFHIINRSLTERNKYTKYQHHNHHPVPNPPSPPPFLKKRLSSLLRRHQKKKTSIFLLNLPPHLRSSSPSQQSLLLPHPVRRR